MILFDDIDNSYNLKVKQESQASRREAKQSFKYDNRDNKCIEAINLAGGLPKENEVQNFFSAGMSDAGSFLKAVLEEWGTIDEATICTWTISKFNVLKLIEYLDSGKIKKLNFLINDGLLKTNSTKPIYAMLYSEFKKRGVNFSVVNTHAKIQMYEVDGKFVTISGSGNWSENPRIENYILIGGKQTYDFNVNYVKSLISNNRL